MGIGHCIPVECKDMPPTLSLTITFRLTNPKTVVCLETICENDQGVVFEFWPNIFQLF